MVVLSLKHDEHQSDKARCKFASISTTAYLSSILVTTRPTNLFECKRTDCLFTVMVLSHSSTPGDVSGWERRLCSVGCRLPMVSWNSSVAKWK